MRLAVEGQLHLVLAETDEGQLAAVERAQIGLWTQSQMFPAAR
jgi:hypothetical protein